MTYLYSYLHARFETLTDDDTCLWVSHALNVAPSEYRRLH